MKRHTGKTFIADTELVNIGTADGLYFHKGFLIKYDGIYFYSLTIRNEIKYGALECMKEYADYVAMKKSITK
ncbi:hypothetical protein L4D09_25625 [Photobacterium makurazakiensis]|uniref:hypothetical protein n=1 Tax=Photobacterium makurazakiensis TaxID=2910234 RepID=UPI003D0F549F